jgi:tetratricopeptide (TPR) repeat protein
MGEHPDDEELGAFLAGGLPGAARNAVLLHLSRNCPQCRRRLASLAGRALGMEPAAVSPPVSDYDSALDRAFAVARQQGQNLAGRRDGRTLAEELIAKSRELRYRDPAGMVRLAEMARLVVSQVRPDRPDSLEAAPVADLEARVYAELANAYRVAQDLEAAESAMAEAEARLPEGTGDLLLKAYLLELKASLHRDQKRFAEASSLLRRAHGLYIEMGERHLAGRTLVSRGLFVGSAGDMEGALRFLAVGVNEIDPARDPKLACMAEQNVAWVLTLGGRFVDARERLAESDLRHVLDDEPLLVVRRQWLEGRIALGLGDRQCAESAFRAAHGAFLEVGQTYEAALVAQDLAAARTGSAPSGLRAC